MPYLLEIIDLLAILNGLMSLFLGHFSPTLGQSWGGGSPSQDKGLWRAFGMNMFDTVGGGDRDREIGRCMQLPELASQ